MTLVFILCAWLFAVPLALIPFSSNLEYVFAEKVILKNNAFFTNNFVHLEPAKLWAENLLTFDPEKCANSSLEILQKIRNSFTWRDLQKAIGNSPSTIYIEPLRYFG